MAASPRVQPEGLPRRGGLRRALPGVQEHRGVEHRRDRVPHQGLGRRGGVDRHAATSWPRRWTRAARQGEEVSRDAPGTPARAHRRRRWPRARDPPVGGVQPEAERPWWAWLMIAPIVLGLSVFYLWPVVQTAATSASPSGGRSAATRGAGWTTTSACLATREVRRALLNTLVHRARAARHPGRARLRRAAQHQGSARGGLLPRAVLPPGGHLAGGRGLVWRYLYNGDFGIINCLLSSSASTARTGSPTRIALYAAGRGRHLEQRRLQHRHLPGRRCRRIPKDLYEAAALDGAGRSGSSSITLPHAQPEHLLRLGALGHRLAADVRPGLRDARSARTRPARSTRDGRRAVLRAGLRRQRPGLCRGDRLRLLV